MKVHFLWVISLLYSLAIAGGQDAKVPERYSRSQLAETDLNIVMGLALGPKLDRYTKPNPLAVEELRRRPGAAEHLIVAMERISTDEWRDYGITGHLSALGELLETSESQKMRIMRVITQQWAKFRDGTTGKPRPDANSDFFGAADFLKAYPSSDSERLLLEMLEDKRVSYAAVPALGESGSAAVLPVLRGKLEEARDHLDKFPGDTTHDFDRLTNAVQTLEGRVRTGAAPASYGPASWATGGEPVVGGTGRKREVRSGSFWSEPFAWASGGLVLAAILAVVFRRIKVRRT